MATGILDSYVKADKFLDTMVVHVMPCVKMYFRGITHPFKSAGRDVIMLQVELMIPHSDKRLKTCVKGILQKPCGQKRENWVNHNAKI